MSDDVFEEDLFPPTGEGLHVDLGGYEGPLDVLLNLARDQKVDLIQISVLKLADQYLSWIAEARRLNLELAADYLVMASWLAYLKSRLLLPKEEDQEEPTGEEMAAALAFQLRRLEAMREAGTKLLARAQLGRDRMQRGAADNPSLSYRMVFNISLFDLLRAYANSIQRQSGRTMSIEPQKLYSMEMALERLQKALGRIPDWTRLSAYLPTSVMEPLVRRSAVASTFAASLELVREGRLMLRQDTVFGPIYLKDRDDERI